MQLTDDNIGFWSETHQRVMPADSVTVLCLSFLIRKMGVRIISVAECCWEAVMRS